MSLVLDPHDPRPLYRQIEDWFRQAIAAGTLTPGTRLPASRALAERLAVSRITVERAYAELAADGTVEGRGSGGTVVTGRQLRSEVPLPRWQRAAVEARGTPRPAPTPREGGRPPLDLSGGLGDLGLFDLAAFNRVLTTVRLRDGADALDYGDPRGYEPLRRVIAGILAAQGLEAHADHILVTAGSQQAITLAASCLLGPGDTVVVERPTYNSALDLFRVLGLNVVDVPQGKRGLDLDALEEALVVHRPRMIYTMPTFHNPTGVAMDLDHRLGLLDAAVRHDVPILEDDFVGDLRYEGRGHPSLKALDRTGHVIYVSTFSKMLLPGLRTGYLVLDGPVFDLLAEHKRVTDLASATLIQRTLADYVGVGRYQNHLKRSVRLYRQRRDAAAAALAAHAPGLRFVVPQGGLFLWLEAPENDPTAPGPDLATQALGVGVKLAPGGPFFADPNQGHRFARLNFAAHDEANLEEAARRLGTVYGSRLASSS